MEPPTLEELVREIGISQDQLDQRCSDEHLNRISLFLDCNWRIISPHLGLSRRDIEDVESEKRTESERRLTALQKWKTVCGCKATLKSLVVVLLSVRNADDAERVCRLLQSQAGRFPPSTTIVSPGGRDTPTPMSPRQSVELEKKSEKGGFSPSTAICSSGGGDTSTPKSPRNGTAEEDEGLVYGCGCGHCSFSSFIENGCPDPTITKTGLPFLNTSKLGDVETEYLVGRLYDESREMICAFQHLVSTTFTSISNQGITPSQLSVSLLSLSTLSPVLPKPHVPLFHERSEDLRNAKSVYDVGFVIHDYLSFFHFEIIEQIIKAFGTSKDKAQLESYMSKLDRYGRHRLFECPPQYGYSSKRQHTSIAVKLDEDLEVFTVKQLKRFWSRMARHLHLSEYALRLVSVEEGCMQLLFQIPSFVTHLVFPLSTEQETALKEENVIELKCGLHTFSPKRMSPPPATPPSSLPPSLESSQQESQEFDMIAALQGAGVPHITEQLFSYFDSSSLMKAEAVSTLWRATIGRLPVWKHLLQQNVKNEKLWRGLFERRGWSKYLHVPLSQQTSSQFYRHLHQSASRDIHSLETNWRRGHYTLTKVDIETGSLVLCLQYDDKKIVTGHDDHTIKILDRNTLQVSMVLKGHKGDVWCLQYNEEMVISGSYDQTVKVWDIQTGQMMNELLHHKNIVKSLKFTTETLVTGCLDYTVAVWDIKSPTAITLRTVLMGHRGSVYAVDLSEANIISGSYDKTIKVWDKFTGGLVRTLHGHSAGVMSLQLRGSHLISGSADKTIRIWNIDSGDCIRVLHGHAHWVFCVAMDNNRIISGSRDKTVKVWDLAAALDSGSSSDALCVVTLKEHTAEVWAVSFDAFQLITGCDDGSVHIHNFLDPTASS